MAGINILFGGNRGKEGPPGDQGPPGPEGPGFRAQGPFVLGANYQPGDAVTADATVAPGIQSLFVQRADIPLSPAVLPPRDEPSRWVEIGAVDLTNFTGAIWRVIQLNHGFTAVGQPVGYSPIANRWVLASNKIGEVPAVAVVREIVGPNEVVLQGSGDIVNLDPSVIFPQPAVFEPGRFYYVSSTIGCLSTTPTAPSPGFGSNAMLVATSATTGVVLQWQQTPNVVGKRPVGFSDFYFTATPGQTVFTGLDLAGNDLIYEVSDQTQVFVDGALLPALGGFTATSGSDVVLASPLVGGELVQIRTLAEPLTAIAPATALPADNIAGQFDGLSRTFPLTVGGGSPVALGPAQNVIVVLDGNVIEPFIDYDLIPGVSTDTDIEFTVAPPAGTRFWAVVGVAVSNLSFLQVNTLVGDSVTATTFQSDTGAINNLTTTTLSAGSATVTGALSGNTATLTSWLRGPNGTAGTPTFSFTGRTDVGVYSPAAAQLGVSTAGVLRLSVSNTAVTAAAGVAFTGSGSGLTNLNASNLGTGTVPLARLAPEVVRTDTVQTITGAKTFTAQIDTTGVLASGTVEALTLRASTLRGPTAGGQITLLDVILDEGVF